jgi:ATP-binding cassette, subfamily B, bacterial
MRLANNVERPSSASRSRFDRYREKVRQRELPASGSLHLADPKLLILDEATSNLDTDSEQLIQQSLATLLHGRTSFVIAHRLSTIAGADLIVVVENGRISQTGTHAELMKMGGKYRTMVEQQIHMTLGGMAPGQNPSVTAADQHLHQVISPR